MKRIFLFLIVCTIIVELHAQNTHYVDVRVREKNTPNYVINSYSGSQGAQNDFSTDLMMAAARSRAISFKEYSSKAYAALNNGDKYGFITYTNYALSTDFYNAQMYYDRGVVFKELGDYKNAKKEFKKAKKHGYYQANQALAELKELNKRKKR